MLSMDSSKWTSFSKHVAPLYEIKPSHQFIRKNELRVQNHSRFNLPYNLEGGGLWGPLWGPMCLSCSSLAIHYGNSHQFQSSSKFFAIEHGFSNHLCGSTKILNSQIKAVFHSQEGKTNH